ncbi:MAG: putative dephospho-CoA kinase [Bacteroidota bacterium]|jgi:dephospho-CoA kinase|nr:putative dephospho-CoA kinase [Bacteroidota bacterium]
MIIGLTGGIGSGKSTVAKLLETMGAVVYNSDERAKQLYLNSSVKLEIIKLLGENAYLSSNELNRKYVADKVFSDNALLNQLNNILHPAVKQDFNQFIQSYPDHTLLIKESALLFETGLFKELDFTILVTSTLEIKIERVMKRNSLQREEIIKRIAAQWPDEKKIPLADYVIVNDNCHSLIQQATQLITQLNKHV